TVVVDVLHVPLERGAHGEGLHVDVGAVLRGELRREVPDGCGLDPRASTRHGTSTQASAGRFVLRNPRFGTLPWTTRGAPGGSPPGAQRPGRASPQAGVPSSSGVRMISTGLCAWAAHAALTDPRSSPANPPRPRLPRTSMRAFVLISVRTWAGRPRLTMVRSASGGCPWKASATADFRILVASTWGRDSASGDHAA